MLKVKERSGFIILLTGVSGSGKTTLGLALKKELQQCDRHPVELIDGDTVRDFYEQKFGYGLEERFAVTKNIAFAASLLAKNGIDVIVANIAGQYIVRDFLRRKWENYIQIFLDADIADCINNDPKKVYATTMPKDNPQLLGVDLPYERPRTPDVIVHPYKESVEDSLQKIKAFLSQKGVLQK